MAAKVAPPGGQARLHRIIATNTNAGTRYIQVFDAAALPGNGATPLMTFPLTAGQSFVPPVDLGVYGRVFQAGVVIANSTTETTLTLGSADSFFDLLVS
jgi:hypothetical protein